MDIIIVMATRLAVIIVLSSISWKLTSGPLNQQYIIVMRQRMASTAAVTNREPVHKM